VELPFARAHRQPSVEVATGLGRQFDLQPVAPATDFEFDDARAAVATDRGDGAGYRSCLAVAEFEVVRPEVEAGGTVGQVGAREQLLRPRRATVPAIAPASRSLCPRPCGRRYRRAGL